MDKDLLNRMRECQDMLHGLPTTVKTFLEDIEANVLEVPEVTREKQSRLTYMVEQKKRELQELNTKIKQNETVKNEVSEARQELEKSINEYYKSTVENSEDLEHQKAELETKVEQLKENIDLESFKIRVYSNISRVRWDQSEDCKGLILKGNLVERFHIKDTNRFKRVNNLWGLIEDA